MRIVFASTPSQEKEICRLARYIYSTVFPLYYSDEEINEFEEIKVLQESYSHFEDISTLKDAFQVMASMQTLISILESPILYEDYASIFNKNVTILEEYGLSFPFEFNQFVEAKNLKNGMFSVYTKAANELLV